jgi:hypothetical protein
MMMMDQDMQALILSYMYTPSAQPLPFGKDIRPNIPLSCPTGNCTWPAYDTLGVCSACEDISELLTYDCKYGSLTWISNGTNGASYYTPSGRYNGTMCGWFVNGTSTDPDVEPVFMTGHRKATGNLTNEESLVTRVLPLVDAMTRKPLYGTGSYRFKNVQNALTDFFVVSAANSTNSTYTKAKPVAQECMLAWCVKTLKSAYIQANYSEEVTHTFLNTTPSEYPWKSTFMDNGWGWGYVINYTRAIHLDYNGTQYGASKPAHSRVTYAFDDYFPSMHLRSNESNADILRYTVQRGDGPPWLRTLQYNPFLAPNNVTLFMERMAIGMTDKMRTSNQHEWVDGNAYNVESYVLVRWGWLTLPLGLLLLTLFFLVGTVVRSSVVKDDVGVWKTSAVATLLYGLPDDMQKKIAALAPEDGSRTPRMKARSLEISMLPTKKGWRASGDMLGPFTPKFKPTQPPPGWI